MRPMRPKAALRTIAPGLVLVLSACTVPSVSPSPTGAPGPASSSAVPSASPTPAPSPVPSVQPTPSVEIGHPGQPYDEAAILEAMQGSRRPGGVPDELETPDIAAAVAEQVWTYAGAPWQTLVIGASCGPERCTLDVAGTPEGGAGEDLYTFSIVPASSAVSLLVADLHGYPTALDAELDAVARGGLDTERLAGLKLLGARWLQPPEAGRFVLSYRSGGEEGSEALDVVIDLRSRTVLEVRRPPQ